MENKIRVVPDACCFLSDVQMISLANPERLRIILSAQKKSFSDAEMRVVFLAKHKPIIV